jgi:hypothetical protein
VNTGLEHSGGRGRGHEKQHGHDERSFDFHDESIWAQRAGVSMSAHRALDILHV